MAKKRVSRKPALDLARARRRLVYFLSLAREIPSLRRRAPCQAVWQVEFELLGAVRMRKLNRSYRGKNYATDVLSFPSPVVFRAEGQLGELVVCGPVVTRQAREQGHSWSRELDVLLVHGILHLLDFDHDRSQAEASRMARYEKRLLAGGPAGPGLIARARRGT